MDTPKVFNSTSEAADYLFAYAKSNQQDEIRVATPLGLGKPNNLLNLLYLRAKHNPSLRLTIYTALSLNPPSPRKFRLSRRFSDPFRKRQWGNDYPELEYAKDSQQGRLPENIRVHEFYFQAGAALQSEQLQRNYQSINYTHVVDSLFRLDVRIVVQLISRKSTSGVSLYSLSSNPDLTLDAADLYKKKGKTLLIVGVIHPDLPFLGGEAEVEEKFFDVIVDDSAIKHQLFALPRLPISPIDHSIGFFASQLIADEGTLQIGIGSLSDAVVSSLILRQKKNDLYASLVETIWQGCPRPLGIDLEKDPFSHGLYGLSEMITDGFMHLRREGILTRHVKDEKSGSETYLHGAFFLGSKEFYSWLRSLTGQEFEGLRMSRISKVNDIYDPNEVVLRAQRKNPRFLNTCMQVTLLGGAASDTLEDGRVISGVGGQYNFVAMSHELQDSRSILMLRSVREDQGKRRSNIVWSHGHLTIPRHLRDIVVTEYGIADLRGKTDEETICALLNITDSEFQNELTHLAKKNHKLAADYQIPEWARNNIPQKIANFIEKGIPRGAFSPFPLGSDFTPEEELLALGLERIERVATSSKFSDKFKMASWIFHLPRHAAKKFSKELNRMELQKPQDLMGKIERRILLNALNEIKIASKNSKILAE
ncbi:MAG: acetyl-CoA hydrolase/transferase C-terminal domain-containing protein [Bdellovibrionia bacterium]